MMVVVSVAIVVVVHLLVFDDFAFLPWLVCKL